jgi:hypothetical protein
VGFCWVANRLGLGGKGGAIINGSVPEFCTLSEVHYTNTERTRAMNFMKRDDLNERTR